MNLAGVLHSVARMIPGARAVSQGVLTWSYAQFADRVARSAGYLRALPGVRPGDRVGIAMENCPSFLQVLYACWHAGLCPVPMNAKLHAREFAYILDNAAAALCFASPSLYPAIAQELGRNAKTQVLEADDALFERLAAAPMMPPHVWQAEDAAWLFYTSGTTGRPKGATLSVRNLIFMSLAYYADIDMLDERDCIVHAAPLSHGSGLYALPHIAKGSHQIIPASGHFSVSEMFELIERWPNVSFFAAPTMLVRLLNDGSAQQAKLDHLKCIMYGGAPMYLADLQRALQLFGPRLFQIYGQGEAPMTITGLGKRAHQQAWRDNDLAALASAGSARSGVEVRIVDAQGHAAASGTIGEITTRSDCVMNGYWNDYQSTSHAIRDGWLYTGDIGSMDERGYVTLKDRSKDMIISGGSNIYPREIEDVLLQHPGVAQASVVGAPHAEWGEEVVAFIVTKSGAALTQQELDAMCLSHIARFKRPRRYLFVDDLPKNNYGKVLKTALRERLARRA